VTFAGDVPAGIEQAGVDAVQVAVPTCMSYAASLTLPDGARGTYDPTSHPAQHCLMEAADQGYPSLTIAKCVQDGGSLASFALILRRIHALAQTAIIAYPTQSAAKDAWTTKVWPMLAAQGGTTPNSGGGSRGGASSVVTLPSGGRAILRAAGGRHESGQASSTGDCLLIDEVDDWPGMRRVLLIERRITKSMDPLIVYVSTVKRDGEGALGSHILALNQSGTQTRLHYPCPHCGKAQAYELEMLNHEHCALVCTHCAALITEPQRIESLRHWQRVDGAKSRRFSILWTALDSPFPITVSGVRYPIMEGLGEEWRQAQAQLALGDHGMLRQYYRDRFCRPYRADLATDDDGQTLVPTRNRLAALSAASVITLDVDRREPDGDSVHLAHVPAWVEHMAMAVDVQRGGERAPGRLYFEVIGRGGGRGAICGYGSVHLSVMGRAPTTEELHAGLDRLNGIMKDWAPSAPIVRRGVDVGDRQDEIRKWLRLHPDWLALKGSGPLKALEGDRPGWIYRRPQDGGWVLHLVETESATRAVQAELLAGAGVGSIALPHGLRRESALVMHLCATVEYAPGKWSTKPADRKHHPEWQARNDYLDCAAYARALIYHWETRAKRAPLKTGYLGDLK